MSGIAEPDREDGQHYRALFDANPQPMWVVDEQTERFLAVNDAAVAHFGYARDTFLAMTIGQVRAPGEPRGLVGLDPASAGPRRVAVRRYLRRDRAEIDAEVWVQVLDWGGRRARLALLRDVTDQRRAERELRESEERLRLLNAELEARVRERTRELEAARAELQEFIDGMSTMAAKLTPEGRFLAANKGSLAASGLTLEQLLQTDIASGAWFAYDEQVQARARRALERARGGTPVSYADKVKVGDHLVDITFSLVPVRGAGGQVDYIIAEGRDITSLKAAEAELLRSSRRLEEANRELEAFSYSVSHDLRAPVRHIEGFAHMLEQELKAPSAKASHYLGTISGAAKRMGALIEDLLMLSRTSRQPLALRQVDLAPVVAEVLAEVRRDAGDRRIRFEIGPLPAVMADASLIRVVLLNLLSNAVKYTRPRAEALVEVGSRAGADGMLEVFVRDNGVGFDMRYAGKLFGVFQRLHRDEDFEGTGIGLATARRILARHEGWIRAEGEPDKGATMTFSLKRAEGAA